MLQQLATAEDEIEYNRRNKGKYIEQKTINFYNKLDKDINDAVGLTLVERTMME